MHDVKTRARGIRLRNVLSQARFFGTDDLRVTSCCSDSRSCQPGDLFVALVGAHDDGHDHVQHAVARGATAVLAERPLPVAVPTCVVKDTRKALGVVCQELAGRPSQRMRLVGISGTSGKTATSLLLSAILAADERDAGLINSLNAYDSQQLHDVTCPDPGPPQMADWLARMAAAGCRDAVVEASSLALSQYHLAGVELEGAIMTNVRRDHLDLHGSVVNYRNVKKRLFELLRPGGFAVVNGDDPATRFLLPHIEGPTITVAIHGDAQITATVVERHPSEQTFLINAGQESVPVRTPIVGNRHVYNCLSAAAAALVMGIDLTTVVRGLERVDRIPGRMDRIECGQPFTTYVDRIRTADCLAQSLKDAQRGTDGKVICVLRAASEFGSEARAMMGRVAEKGSATLAVTGAEAGQLDTIHDVLDGCEHPGRAMVMPRPERAIRWAIDRAERGDVVLVASCDGPRSAAGFTHEQDRAFTEAYLRRRAERDFSLVSSPFFSSRHLN